MEKKINEINEAFEHQRFEECLTIIEQTLKKYSKPEKKKQQVTPKDIKEVQCFKVGCLASLAKFHEADALYRKCYNMLEQLVEPGSLEIFGDQFVLLLTSISQLFGENREKKMLQLLNTRTNIKRQSLYRFFLGSRMFSDLSKMLLKQFTTGANISMLMGQIYVEYLQCLQRVNLIEYKRDGWYKFDQRLKMGLKMVSMFMAKCDERIEANRVLHEKNMATQSIIDQGVAEKQLKMSLKLAEQSKLLKLRMAINEGRVLDAISMFQKNRDNIKFPFTFIRSILKLKTVTQDKKIIDDFYVRQMSLTFRKNLNFNLYTPWYDYYNEFLWTMVGEAEALTPDLKQSLQLKEQDIDWQQLYLFPSSKPNSVIPLYFNSLASEYKHLLDPQSPSYQQSKKSDYYKICLKGLLLQLIQISDYFGLNEVFLKYLSDYSKHFGNTLTFAEQTKKYWDTLFKKDIFKIPQEIKTDNDLIREINYLKIKTSVETKEVSLEGFMNCFQVLKKLYTVRVKEIECNRKLEKGQRYLSDEFYTLIADYARAFVEKCSDSQSILQVCNILINQLEQAIKVSPYNADTKLRLMYFCSLVNHHERMKEVFFTNDIKSVQWQTLGYWFIRAGIEFGTTEHDEQFIMKMVKSYQENQRETSEYAFKSIKGGELQRIDQYLCYRDCILNSYNSIVILYLLYHLHRFEHNSEYYLSRINQRINQFKRGERCLTFNADYKVMRNQIFEDSHFADFYGVFNSYEYLQLEVQLALHEHALIAQIVGKNQENVIKDVMDIGKLEECLNGFEVGKCFDFSRYTFQEGAPHIHPEHNKYSLMRIDSYLQSCKLINQVRISVILLIQELNSFLKSQQVNKESVNHLRERVKKTLNDLTVSFAKMDYLSQINSFTMVRRGLFESFNLLSLFRELVSKTKKLKFAKELVSESTSECQKVFMERIENMRWSAKTEESSKLVSGRDEELQKQLAIDQSQIKRFLAKYQSLYKL